MNIINNYNFDIHDNNIYNKNIYLLIKEKYTDLPIKITNQINNNKSVNVRSISLKNILKKTVVGIFNSNLLHNMIYTTILVKKYKRLILPRIENNKSRKINDINFIKCSNNNSSILNTLEWYKSNYYDFSNHVISNDCSKIINLKRKEEIKFGSTFDGYTNAKLHSVDNKRVSLLIHKIVNQVFNGKDYNDIVDHKNSKRYDNSVINLESVTQKENNIRAKGRSVRQIDLKTGETIKIFRSIVEARESLNSKRTVNISRVCKEKQKSALGYGWEYLI